jgi:hypothetical protein
VPFRNLLRSGTNVVAIQLSNVWQSGWDNVAFNIALKAIPSARDARVQSVLRSGQVANITIKAPVGSTFRLDSCDGFDKLWQSVQTVSNITSNVVTIVDSGQTGRPAPGAAAMRFYRVVPL